jgi:hypothetical protein
MTVTPSYKRMPFESDSWAQMGNMSFPEILVYSKMFPEWAEWRFVLETYRNDLLKPVDMYVHHFGVKPKVIRESPNIAIIKYYTYADILFQIPDPPMGHIGIFESRPMDGMFYSTDKCWQRQFYPVDNFANTNTEELISNRQFKFYIPWIVDEDMEYIIVNGNDHSPFRIEEGTGSFTKSSQNDIIKNTNFVNFYFKKLPENMVADTCGVIERGSYMFELEVYSDSNIIDRLCLENNANN